MQIFFIILMYLLLFTFLFLFIKETSKLAYKLNKNKNDNVREDDNLKLFYIYKGISYTMLILILVLSIFLSSNIKLDGWIYIFNIIWVITLLFIKLNISLIDHLLNVMYVRNSVKYIEKEFLIGGILKDNHRFYFSYRLTLDKFYI